MQASNAFSLVDRIIQLLPTSPFQPYISQLASIPWLPYLNWFFPIAQCLQVAGAWLVAVGLFYVYSMIMRWVKVIGD